MTTFTILKAEFYKNIKRKSSLILFIPVLLSFLITLGFRTGAVTLSMPQKTTDTFSCMDYLFMNWTVLSALGIIGVLLLLFSAFQFSGEIERGQIKSYLLRSGTRGSVLTGKYIAAVSAAIITMLATLLCTIIFYYILIARSSVGNGGFLATIDQMTTEALLAYIGLGLITYPLWIAITFLIGLYCGPFVDFILSAAFLYGGNYLAAQDTAVSRLLPSYWGEQLLSGKWDSILPVIGSVAAVLVLTAAVLMLAVWRFNRLDIK